MTDSTAQEAGDFVRIASCGTPTEAHLLKGVLEAAGLSPQVADANIVQANTWMTQAVGGVRVLVPASQEAAAREVLVDFNAGAYQLEGEEVAAPRYATLRAPVFSPDRAVLLSFVLTPAFGAAVQIVNASSLDAKGPRTGAWVWLVLLAIASLLAVFAVHLLNPGPLVVFRASLGLSFITLAWYFIAGQDQSRALLKEYGVQYRKRSLVPPALAAAVASLALGWALAELG